MISRITIIPIQFSEGRIFSGRRAPNFSDVPTTYRSGTMERSCKDEEPHPSTVSLEPAASRSTKLTGALLSGGHASAASDATCTQAMAACRLRAARRGLADGGAELNAALTQLSTCSVATDGRSEGPIPSPVFETAQIVSQMISKVFSNVMLSIETQEVAASVGKMRVGDGGRRQPRHQPYSRTPPKASVPSHPRTNSMNGDD